MFIQTHLDAKGIKRPTFFKQLAKAPTFNQVTNIFRLSLKSKYFNYV